MTATSMCEQLQTYPDQWQGVCFAAHNDILAAGHSSSPMFPNDTAIIPDYRALLETQVHVDEGTTTQQTNTRHSPTQTSKGRRCPDSASMSSADHNQDILGGKTIESSLYTDNFGNPILKEKSIFQCWDHGCDGRNFSSLSNIAAIAEKDAHWGRSAVRIAAKHSHTLLDATCTSSRDDALL